LPEMLGPQERSVNADSGGEKDRSARFVINYLVISRFAESGSTFTPPFCLC